MVENPAIPAIDLLPLGVRGYQDLGTVRGAGEGPARGPIALLGADVAREPAVWAAYRRGLHETYAALGAAHLAPLLGFCESLSRHHAPILVSP